VQAFLTAKGKITGAWEEAAHGGGIDKANCYLVGWVNVEGSQKLAAEGYDVVVAPGQAYYLDMANGPDWHEPGAGWAGWSSPEKAYRFDPTAGWSEGEKARFLGVQACIWSEPFTERVTKGSTELYRARFAGFDQDAAEAACKYFKRNEIACMATKN